MTYGEGEVRAHIAIAWELCQALEIGEHFNPGADYSSLGVAQVKSLTYEQEYLKYMQEGLWTIVLADRSLLQFKFDASDPNNYLSYAYYESPFLILSFAEFVNEQRGRLQDHSLPGELFEDDYEQYKANPDTAKLYVTPIRYDYSPGLYTAGNHPASHVHIGYQNSVRIGTGRVLRPSSFVCLVARQCYPDDWLRFLRGQEDNAARHCRQIHEALMEVPTEYFGPMDLAETGLELPRDRPAIGPGPRAQRPRR